MPRLAEPTQSGDNSDIDEHLRNFNDGGQPTNVRRPNTGPDPEFLGSGSGNPGGRELPVSPSAAHGGDAHGGGRGARRADARDRHNASSSGDSGKPKLAEPHGGGKSFDAKNAAIDKAVDKIPGGKKDADGNPIAKGGAEKAVDKAAGKGAEAALTATGVGATVAKPVGKAVEKVGVRRITKIAAIGAAIMLTPLFLLLFVFTYVATHPWEAAKEVITNSSIRRFALNAAKQAGTSTVDTIIGALSYETDYKPGSAIAATGQRPEAGTMLDTISKIDFEKSKNRYKNANCPYKVVTKKVVAFDGKQRSVIAKVTDKSGATVKTSDPEVFTCILQQYPVVETMMRSPEARKINKQMNVNLSYAEKKDSELIDGKSKEEVKDALYKKSLERVWKNSSTSTECVKDFKPTGPKIDQAIALVVNDLLCGTQPKNIDVKYKVDEIPKSLDTDSAQYERRLIAYTKTACTFYKKLNADKEAIKNYQINRAKSSARAGIQALTLADTGIAGEISTNELNNDFYKISNFASSRAYNQEIYGTSTGTQADPESIPTKVLGLTENYFEELAERKDLGATLGELCSKQDKLDDDGAFASIGSFFSGFFGGGSKSKEGYAKDIDDTLDYLKRDIYKTNKDFYKTPDGVTLNDIIVRTVKVTSNASNSGVEDGPNNFNRMTVGAKNTMHNYTISLLGGTYQDDAEAAADSVALETIKRNEDKQSGMIARLFNTKNPRSLASRIAAGSTATPKQITENTTRYALNMLNPIKAFADFNTHIAYVGYGESNKAIAAADDDRAYWKIDTAGTKPALNGAEINTLQNAKEIERMKKSGANAELFASWDKCMETYYPDETAVDKAGDENCMVMRETKGGKKAASYGKNRTLARKYGNYKGNMNMFTAWAKLSSDEQDDSIYAKGENSSGFGVGGAVGADPDGPQSDPGADTSSTSCPQEPGITTASEDTKNGVDAKGVVQTYGPGRVAKNKIKLCNVQGITVNVSVASNLNKMVSAAKAVRLALSGSGWRSYDRQKELRIINGCPADDSASSSSCRVPTARPGNSNHEQGEAVDFNNSRTRGTAVYAWLNGNANKYGFFNFPKEAWHWSRNGK